MSIEQQSVETPRNKSVFFCYVAFLCLGTSWLYPATHLSAVLTWAFVLLLVLFVDQLKRPYLQVFSAGIFAYSIGFHWLFLTIRDFGGFGNFPALLVFLLFVILSSLQFIVFLFAYRNLKNVLRPLLLAPALAWLISEHVSLRIFPWCLGHTQISFTYIAQAADIGGATLISFIVMWTGTAIVECLRKRTFSSQSFLPIASFIVFLVYGAWRVTEFNAVEAPHQEVALVQANISLKEKHNTRMFSINTERYKQLTAPLAGQNLFVVWPETVITEWIYSKLQFVSDDPKGRVPSFDKTSLLIGSLTFESDDRLFNSALGITNEGRILSPSHKQILMPFGEYTPLGDVLPFLKELNSTAGEFTAGKEIVIQNFPSSAGDGNKGFKVAALICYEDIVPSLAREATLSGAELLVNLTNDAWFGDTVAPYQHNLIASFRAIENRRFLLRSTNTGLTAIINPIGKTIETIPPYSEGVLRTKVQLLNSTTFFVLFNVERFLFFGSAVMLIIITFKAARTKLKR